jgi:hypothetical protein
MHITFAMAGLAEAAIFYGLLIIGGVLLLAGGMLAFAWWKRSPFAATIALVLVIIVGLLLQPWTAFAPPTTTDPDEAYWLVRLRVASAVWTVFLITGVACLVTVLGGDADS